MRNQIFKRFIGLALFMTIAIAPVGAQQFNRKIAADIPFKFVISDKVLPAGQYTITYLSPVVMLIRSRDGRIATTVQARSCQSIEEKSRASLVFHKYGDQYFLSQVWMAGDNYGRELLMTRSESELAKAGVTRETATVVQQ